ncbi:MerR family transcriptional regulator [Kineosporia succinea]|uniref:Site-specific integrase-resolvase n=1 Tax=Kineosporia succinea TaxID=84632 RepID=A0ABT9NXW2_9ACTN|nr:hypothetical protein [Kineosporia succinea]MDP9825266.1 putative site-specific integrase-resolvase [Kineosporia succinea]
MQVPDVARAVGRDESTVLRWIYSGQLPASRKLRGPWNVCDAAVAALVAGDPYADQVAA